MLSLSDNDISDRGVLTHIAPALSRIADTTCISSHLELLVLRGNSRISMLGIQSLHEASIAVSHAKQIPFAVYTH